MPAPSRTLVLLAGPSGSGKSHLAGRTDAVSVRLDDFYRDGDAPDLPMIGDLVDWDDVGSFDVEGAVAALEQLVWTGHAEVPLYEISANACVGSQTLTAPEGSVVVAEGIFAMDLLQPCRDAGLAPRAVWLQRPAALVFGLRLVRDLREHRKPPHVLVPRGLRLAAQQRALARRAQNLGFESYGLRRAVAMIKTITTEENHV